MAFKRNKKKPKMYRGKKSKYSASEKRAYLIGLGRGAVCIAGSGKTERQGQMTYKDYAKAHEYGARAKSKYIQKK